MGQGANQAIVDAYVVSKRLAAAAASSTASGSSDGTTMMNGVTEMTTSTAVAKALRDYDSKKRRKDNNLVITKARYYGKFVTSKNRILNKIMRWAVKVTPPSNLLREMVSGDRSNKEFVKKLEEDLRKKK